MKTIKMTVVLAVEVDNDVNTEDVFLGLNKEDAYAMVGLDRIDSEIIGYETINSEEVLP